MAIRLTWAIGLTHPINSRAIAARLSWQIIDQGKSLDGALRGYFDQHELNVQDQGLTQELVYGICRWYGDLDHVAAALLNSPIRKKDRIVHFVLMVGLYQLRYLQTAEHAAVAETVNACVQLQKPWAKQLINGCLRNYLRDPQLNLSAQQLNQKQSKLSQLSHPAWMVKALKDAWPDHITEILVANNQRPPMILRVNQRFGSRKNYLGALQTVGIKASPDPYSIDGILLSKPVSVTELPDFAKGSVSVQDTAAQLAYEILDIQKGQSVLDACAAPGGKTAHILERIDNQITLHAVDVSEQRSQQLHSTLGRLNLSAEVFIADACKTPNWPTPAKGYDRILIDAPCSGLGVIRRHPDIKHHRRVSDIASLNHTQQLLLHQLWLLLKPGGLLLYMTCSVLPVENNLQIKSFLGTHKDAHAPDFHHPHALNLEFGKQTLPGVHAMDGFYYCLLTKTHA